MKIINLEYFINKYLINSRFFFYKEREINIFVLDNIKYLDNKKDIDILK